VAPIVEEPDAFSNLEDRVSNFAENSKTIMAMWDELAKAYPFISGAPAIYLMMLGIHTAFTQLLFRFARGPSSSNSRGKTTMRRSEH
jgi:hypothetical protein